jgi:hypothetical protein
LPGKFVACKIALPFERDSAIIVWMAAYGVPSAVAKLERASGPDA